jgi:hypothetical protein
MLLASAMDVPLTEKQNEPHPPFFQKRTFKAVGFQFFVKIFVDSVYE